MTNPPTSRAPGSSRLSGTDDPEAVTKPLPVGGQPVAVPDDDADAAFRSLYAEHGPALLRLATGLTGGDRHRAEDLVQETMLRAWTHRNNLDIPHRSPRAVIGSHPRSCRIGHLGRAPFGEDVQEGVSYS